MTKKHSNLENRVLAEGGNATRRKHSNLFNFAGSALLSLACLFNSADNARAVSAHLAWDAPKTYTDGSELTDLGGYRLYFGAGTAERVYPSVVDVGNRTDYIFTNTIRGVKYRFAVTCFSSSGTESDFSDEVSLRVPFTIDQCPKVTEVVPGDSNTLYKIEMDNIGNDTNQNTIVDCNFICTRQGGETDTITVAGTNKEVYANSLSLKPGCIYNVNAYFRYIPSDTTNVLKTESSPKITIALANENSTDQSLGFTLGTYTRYTTNQEITLKGSSSGINSRDVYLGGDIDVKSPSLITTNSSWTKEGTLKKTGINNLSAFVGDSIGNSSATNYFTVVYDPMTDTNGNGQTDVQEMLMGGSFGISGISCTSNGVRLELPVKKDVNYTITRGLSPHIESITNFVAPCENPNYSVLIGETNSSGFYSAILDLRSLINTIK